MVLILLWSFFSTACGFRFSFICSILLEYVRIEFLCVVMDFTHAGDLVGILGAIDCYAELGRAISNNPLTKINQCE